jgi:hypothetical protein
MEQRPACRGSSPVPIGETHFDVPLPCSAARFRPDILNRADREAIGTVVRDRELSHGARTAEPADHAHQRFTRLDGERLGQGAIGQDGGNPLLDLVNRPAQPLGHAQQRLGCEHPGGQPTDCRRIRKIGCEVADPNGPEASHDLRPSNVRTRRDGQPIRHVSSRGLIGDAKDCVGRRRTDAEELRDRVHAGCRVVRGAQHTQARAFASATDDAPLLLQPPQRTPQRHASHAELSGEQVLARQQLVRRERVEPLAQQEVSPVVPWQGKGALLGSTCGICHRRLTLPLASSRRKCTVH